MNHLPIFMDIKGRPVLVVGGSELAARKVERIHRALGRVTVVAESLCPSLQDLVERDEVEHKARAFDDTDLEGCFLVFVAGDDEDLAKRISKLAREAEIPINVADTISLCTFIMPAVIDRSPIMVTVSSGGAAPILTRA